jgi:hypothetical protein
MVILRGALDPNVLLVIESVEKMMNDRLMPPENQRSEKLLYAINLRIKTKTQLDTVFMRLLDGIYGNAVRLFIITVLSFVCRKSNRFRACPTTR